MNKIYGRRLNPFRKYRDPFGVKAIRQSVVITNNPSSIDQNQQLLVRFPNLGSNDLIVPGTTRLSFTIALTSTDANRTLVQNIGRAAVRKTTIRISGNEVMSLEDSDVYHCYLDCWKTRAERQNAQYQGIDTSEDRNVTRLRIDAGDADQGVVEDKAIAEVYGNRFYIPLDFELLESHVPFHQSSLGDRLEYELTFNSYSRVIQASEDSTYKIENISLEFDMITAPDLAQRISTQYKLKTSVLYERALRHRKIKVNKSDTVWNININTPARSMKGILMLFEDPSGTRDTEKFYNPKIEKVEMTIEGVPNQLYSQGMRMYQQWDEARKFMGGSLKRPSEVTTIVKDLDLPNVSLDSYFTSKFCLALDLRSTDDDRLHGSGRAIQNASEGITLQLTKKAEAAGVLNMYIYLIMDAQINIENGRFVNAVY